MATYVMSDLHGNYYLYQKCCRKLRQEIKFSDDDMLYILGDILDKCTCKL